MTPVYPIYRHLAMLVEARDNCIERDMLDMAKMHLDSINDLLSEHAPHGSGIDNGAPFIFGQSSPNSLMFQLDFHHMDDVGYYSGWTHHEVIVRPSLVHGITIRVTGPNRRDIKEYLHQVFDEFLNREVSLTASKS